MSVFDLNYNKDDILLRGVIIGVIASFRDKVILKQTYEQKTEEYTVPFFFRLGGNERYMQDIFLNDYSFDNEGKADGVYEQIPRGIFSLGTVSILSDELTNRFIRGTYTKQEGNELKSYTANVRRVPLSIPSNVEIFVDNITQQFQVIQSIIENVWKNNVFFLDINGIKVAGTYSIGEDFEREQQTEFGFDSDVKLPKVPLSLDIFVEYPVIEGDTEMFSGDAIQSFERSVTIQQVENDGGYRANIDEQGIKEPINNRAWPINPRTTQPPSGGKTK